MCASEQILREGTKHRTLFDDYAEWVSAYWNLIESEQPTEVKLQPYEQTNRPKP